MRLKTAQLFFFCAALLIGFANIAAAQQISPQVLAHAKQIGQTCPQKWETQPCLAAISSSNKTLAVNYMQSLEAKGKKSAMEQVKQLCAASTAATEGEYPAYAMQSAFTECTNGLYDISQKTGVLPDQSHYQLLVGSVLCLSKAPQCAALEAGMQKATR